MYHKKLKSKILSILTSGLMAAAISFGAVDLPALLSANPVYAEDSIEESTVDGGIEDNTEAGTSTTDERAETSTSATIEDVGATDINEIGSSEEIILTGASESQPLSAYAASAIKMEIKNNNYYYTDKDIITATINYGERQVMDGVGFVYNLMQSTQSGILYSIKLSAYTSTKVRAWDNEAATLTYNEIYVYKNLEDIAIAKYNNIVGFDTSTNFFITLPDFELTNCSSEEQTYYIWIKEPSSNLHVFFYNTISIPAVSSLNDTLYKTQNTLDLGETIIKNTDITPYYYYEEYEVWANGGPYSNIRVEEGISYAVMYKIQVPAGKTYHLSEKSNNYSALASDARALDYIFDSNSGIRTLSSNGSDLINDTDQDDTYYIFGQSDKTSSHIKSLILTDISKAKVTSEVKPIGTAPSTTLNTSTAALAESLLTEEDKELHASGEEVDIYLEIADITSTISAENKSKVENAITSNDTVGMYTDINLYKKIGDHDAVKITKVDGNKLSISIALPDSLKNTDASINRTYKIVRLHDSAADILDAKYDAAAGTLTFETDAFSVYAIVYSDTVNTASISDATQASTDIAVGL